MSITFIIGLNKNLFISKKNIIRFISIKRKFQSNLSITVFGIGIGIATGKAVEAIARQPEAAGEIRTSLLLGSALAEATAVYGLVASILIIFLLK